MPYEPEFHRQGAVLLTRTGDASGCGVFHAALAAVVHRKQPLPGGKAGIKGRHVEIVEAPLEYRQEACPKT